MLKEELATPRLGPDFVDHHDEDGDRDHHGPLTHRLVFNLATSSYVLGKNLKRSSRGKGTVNSCIMRG